MPSGKRRITCRICGKAKGPAGEVKFTRSGAHLTCGMRAMVGAQHDLVEHSGPTWDKWREGMVRAAQKGS